jgi:hypothetical protein
MTYNIREVLYSVRRCRENAKALGKGNYAMHDFPAIAYALLEETHWCVRQLVFALAFLFLFGGHLV